MTIEFKAIFPDYVYLHAEIRMVSFSLWTQINPKNEGKMPAIKWHAYHIHAGKLAWSGKRAQEGAAKYCQLGEVFRKKHHMPFRNELPRFMPVFFIMVKSIHGDINVSVGWDRDPFHGNFNVCIARISEKYKNLAKKKQTSTNKYNLWSPVCVP